MPVQQVDTEELIISLRAENADLKCQLAELQRLIFGRKSERFIPTDHAQASLFDPLLGDEPSTTEPATQVQQVEYERVVKPKEKQKPVRALLPAHLPREEEVIEPEDLEEGMKKIGEEVTEILEHIPARLYVRRIVRPKYVKGQEDGVKIGDLPSLPIPKGNAGPGLLAHIQVSKWVDHLPFYRQIQIFKREGVQFADSTLNGWFNATAKLLEPLYDELVSEVKAQDYLQADESPIKVQDGHKQGATHLGYHWVYHAPKSRMAVFDYQPSRSAERPKHFLQYYKGTLQTDGYAAYNRLGNRKDTTLLACMAHVRRKFEKALDNDRKLAEYALAVMQTLYAVERDFKEEEITHWQRMEQTKPILDQWKTWLEDQQNSVPPKSSIGQAVNYTLNLWSRLVRYTDDPMYHIDNNLIENIIRPLAIGRKNYLFAGSHEAAQRAAMFYSFFATCKLNEVEPYQWLKEVLIKIPEAKVNDLSRFLPQNCTAAQVDSVKIKSTSSIQQ